MKKFWLTFLVVLVVVIVTVVLVAFIMSKVHDVTLLQEFQDWWSAIKEFFSKFVKFSETTANIKLIA